MSALPRRRLLAATGAAFTGAIAGCSSDDGEDESENEAAENDDESPDEGETGNSTEVDGTILGEITVNNSDDTSHAVDVIVEFDREIEAWKTESLEANEDVTLERNWPTDPGQFRVTARLDQEELVEVTPAKWNEPNCLNLLVRIDSSGTLMIPGTTDGGPCNDGDADSDAEE
ncbi:hypothetical protein [Natronorubrum halophilum]|uniref:hypothetical protein n=1 Tax=Natronorubrum halophilum TaxID=1702106 RepID=UPI0010C239CD|nr:hypothetical protein [Natronorubrum halophilum]